MYKLDGTVLDDLMPNTKHKLAGTYRTLANGTEVVLGDRGEVVMRFPVGWADDYEDDVATCSVCDGVGHGYPGAGPCPLEMRGADEAELQDRMEARMGIRW